MTDARPPAKAGLLQQVWLGLRLPLRLSLGGGLDVICV